MVLDIFKPFYYYLEKQAAGRIIPDVSFGPDRKLLKDYPITTDDSTAEFDHSKWDSVLKRHVTVQEHLATVNNVHVVDYAGIAADPDFTAYIQQVAQTKPEDLSQAEQLAFWMNAYNALCINLLVRTQKNRTEPIQSINLLSQGAENPVWDQVAGQVNGKDISLNEIEHNQIRRVWAEPAIHACIVCASASCPNLRREAFVASKLPYQMQDQLRDWLSNESKGAVFVKSKNQVLLSRIFLWFEKDFGGTEGVRKFVSSYVAKDETLNHKIRSGRYGLRYFEYDWSINRKGDK